MSKKSTLRPAVALLQSAPKRTTANHPAQATKEPAPLAATREPLPTCADSDQLEAASMASLLLYSLAFESDDDAIADVLGAALWDLARVVGDLYVEAEHSDAVAELATRAHHVERRARVALELRRRELAARKAVAS